MSHEPLCEMLDDLARFHHSDVSIAAQDIAAAMALKDLASCLEQLEHAEQVLRLASLSGHALGIQWARRSVSEVVELLEALRQAFRDEAHR
jgi:transposase